MDVIITRPLAESYVTGSAREAGAAAELATSRRGKGCQHRKRILLCAHRGRNLGRPEHVSLPTLRQSGKKISSTSGDERKGAFLSCREFRCWCNATTLSCYITPCQSLTAQLMICTKICSVFIFELPRNIS